MFKTLFAVLLLFAYTAICHAQTKCDQPKEVGKFAGHYARKSVWDDLPKVKVWAEANRGFDKWISAVDIKPNGEILGAYGVWHEGGNPCIQFRGTELWAKDMTLPNAKWEGPFIRVAQPDSGPQSYFYRTFGDRCYSSNKRESWCFGKGTITVGANQYKAEITLDTSEVPVYGTPVSVHGREGFWVFVPVQNNGWHVFQDTFLTEEGHKNIVPHKTPPWRILMPM